MSLARSDRSSKPRPVDVGRILALLPSMARAVFAITVVTRQRPGVAGAAGRFRLPRRTARGGVGTSAVESGRRAWRRRHLRPRLGGRGPAPPYTALVLADRILGSDDLEDRLWRTTRH
ncbi:MAG TPA: hypothetical protein VL551_34460 [Actinospica sp.]|jgi:hypothetical protein|nr:hypothetical protein [Actinospica sp.]